MEFIIAFIVWFLAHIIWEFEQPLPLVLAFMAFIIFI